MSKDRKYKTPTLSFDVCQFLVTEEDREEYMRVIRAELKAPTLTREQRADLQNQAIEILARSRQMHSRTD